jgi:hypothetical protein
MSEDHNGADDLLDAAPARERLKPGPKPKSASGAKVTVACKMETGLRLRVFNMATSHEPVLGGGSREVKIARFAGEVWVNGVGKKIELAPKAEIVAGYALTHGIDRDHWAKWFADNEESDMVENQLIFAHEDPDYLRGWCREREAMRSGTEPLTGGDDARAPKSALRIEDEEGRAKSSPRVRAA